ncbi:hypothetical protein DPEC_G00339330 [Dallia pectoralis]|uniref:Uncharacterized protein n=1 Tax=Dallia pectoralis TaxID=75939 RepID=A0ACC2F4V8_DALPE|nr:hypothetical protein DPEC_G00339330 [Dallia pectoralis]
MLRNLPRTARDASPQESPHSSLWGIVARYEVAPVEQAGEEVKCALSMLLCTQHWSRWGHRVIIWYGNTCGDDLITNRPTGPRSCHTLSTGGQSALAEGSCAPGVTQTTCSRAASGMFGSWAGVVPHDLLSFLSQMSTTDTYDTSMQMCRGPQDLPLGVFRSRQKGLFHMSFHIACCL